jgi:hypothetical protein
MVGKKEVNVTLFRSLALTAIAASLAFAEDPVAALSHRIDQGAVQLSFDAHYGYLPAVLSALHVPVESQIAVFSKTSAQSFRIEPANPRLLYFNDSVTVGWVNGGFIEIAAQDPGKGIRFYVMEQRPDERLIARPDCVQCHRSGTRLLSVFAGPTGVPSGRIEVDHRTPYSDRWGGWFVTGASVPAGHSGNAVLVNSERRELTPVIDPKVALTTTSDVVALMVFGHQMYVSDLLAHPGNIQELVDALLYVDEAALPGPVRGSSGFAEKFASQGPSDKLGRSLRQFDLKQRMMRYPCSYMIYSDAFDALPSATKEAIYRRLSSILSGELDNTTAGDAYRRLSHADREAIIGILRDTKPDLPAWFGK